MTSRAWLLTGIHLRVKELGGGHGIVQGEVWRAEHGSNCMLRGSQLCCRCEELGGHLLPHASQRAEASAEMRSSWPLERAGRARLVRVARRGEEQADISCDAVTEIVLRLSDRNGALPHSLHK